MLVHVEPSQRHTTLLAVTAHTFIGSLPDPVVIAVAPGGVRTVHVTPSKWRTPPVPNNQTSLGPVPQIVVIAPLDCSISVHTVPSKRYASPPLVAAQTWSGALPHNASTRTPGASVVACKLVPSQ